MLRHGKRWYIPEWLSCWEGKRPGLLLSLGLEGGRGLTRRLGISHTERKGNDSCVVLLGRDERYGCFLAFLGCGSQGPRFWLCLDFLEIPAFFRAGASNRPFGEERVAQQAAITGYSKELLFCQPLIGGELEAGSV